MANVTSPVDLHTATQIAEDLVAELEPYCQLLRIAGSIRRRKPQVHDIELVAVPMMLPVLDLFNEPNAYVSLLDQRLDELIEAGELVPGPKSGPRYRQLSHQGMKVDLFIVLPPAQFGVIYTIRTGPAHYSHWLVTPRHQGGALPSYLRLHNGALYNGDHLIPTPGEAEFYAILGLPVPDPADRQPQWTIRR